MDSRYDTWMSKRLDMQCVPLAELRDHSNHIKEKMQGDKLYSTE